MKRQFSAFRRQRRFIFFNIILAEIYFGNFGFQKQIHISTSDRKWKDNRRRKI